MSAHTLLKASVRKICQLNELTSLLNPWIITPFNPHLAIASDFHPLTTILIYSLLEQISLLGINYVALEPWTVLLWTATTHLGVSLMCLDMFAALRHRELQNTREEKSDSQGSKPRPPKSSSAFWLLPPVLTAALNNATFILYNQTSQAPSRLKQHSNILILSTFATLCFLGCRFADWQIWHRTRRGLDTTTYLTSLLYQLLLLLARVLMRWTAGFQPLISLKTLDEVEAEERFGVQRYRWVKEIGLQRLPDWVMWILPLLCFVFVLSGNLLWGREVKAVWRGGGSRASS
ncbi:hypothetical protein ONS96_000833 [Cadophora gregata f. sp. sojae]|nr:hypothetical protein ONS96_000833 [Cadophora gregata f. sp. sojae]